MRISVQWLRDFVDVDASAQEIADRLSVSGLEVEHFENWESVAGGLKGFVTGHVIECAKHPNADKLSVTKVDIGIGELQPIVCGAPNIAAGQKVIVATVGTQVTVPGKGSFTIGEAKIRGEISRGMICAEDEMGLGNSHDGIMVLPPDTPVGMPAAEYFNVASDEVLEIGLTANRGDAASHLGVARDVAALFGTRVKLPDWNYAPLATAGLEVDCNANECSRYVVFEVTGVSAVPSPDEIQNRLGALGIEPKNILIDATNYTLHALGQPVHAFDADKIRGNKLQVRLANAGEKLITLDKVDRTCKGGELIIADAEGPVAFAGVMGGLESAVSETTTRILIESAHFHPGLVRKTARAHGLNTDASFRFERSTDPEICRNAAWYCANLIISVCGGTLTGGRDKQTAEWKPLVLDLDVSKLNRFAGAEIPAEAAQSILTHLGFECRGNKGMIEVSVPSWRNDIHGEVDLYEEVMRIYGYDQIPMSGKMKASLPVFEGFRKRRITDKTRQYLIDSGFYEANNNSLTSAEYYRESEISELVELSNPLSSDLQYMRGSLLHGLLSSAAYNRNRKTENIRLFETGNVYRKNGNGFSENLRLAILCAGNRNEEGWEEKAKPVDYFFLKRTVQNALAAAGYSEKLENAAAISRVSSEELKKHDLTGEFWYADINWDMVQKAQKPEGFRVTDPPRFPYMRRDLSLVVDKSITFDRLESVIKKQKSAILKEFRVFDVFEGKPLEAGKKAIAIGFFLGNPESTLTDADADALMGKLMKDFESEAGAMIRR